MQRTHLESGGVVFRAAVVVGIDSISSERFCGNGTQPSPASQSWFACVRAPPANPDQYQQPSQLSFRFFPTERQHRTAPDRTTHTSPPKYEGGKR